MIDHTYPINYFGFDYDKVMGDTGDPTHRKTIDPALFKAIGDVKGMTIYDLGCGNGYISRRLIKEGAKEVLASDISADLIKIAQKNYQNPESIKYLVRNATDFSDIPEGHFDLVIMNMAIFYISDLNGLIKGIAKSLKPGGRFVFTAGHPLRQLGRADAKRKRHAETLTLEAIINDARGYIKEKERTGKNSWVNGELRLHTAPISFYINLFRKNGLLTDTLIEPKTDTVLSDVNDQTPVFSDIPTIYALGATKI